MPAITGNAFGSAGRRAAGVPAKSGGAVSSSGWNPNDAYAYIIVNGPIFSNNYDSLDMAVRGTKSQSSGKWYLEALFIHGISNGSTYIGVGNKSASLGAEVGSNSNSIGINASGSILSGNSNVGTGPAPIAGAGGQYGADVIMISVDLGGSAIYFGTNGSWTGGGKPSAGATAFTTPAGPLYIMGSAYRIGAGIYLIMSPANMFYGPPPGFQAWG